VLLVEPRLQLRFGLVFLACGALAALVNGLVFGTLLTRAAEELPHDRFELQSRVLGLLGGGFLLTAVILTPLLFGLGILASFRIFGPLHRFRVFLSRIVRGDRPAPCRIRRDDELQDFCELLNRATAPLRDAPQAEGPAAERRVA